MNAPSIQEMCCICFKNAKYLHSSHKLDEDKNSWVEKLKYCGFDWFDCKSPLEVCQNCSLCIQISYDFRKFCLANKEKFYQFISSTTKKQNEIVLKVKSVAELNHSHIIVKEEIDIKPDYNICNSAKTEIVNIDNTETIEDIIDSPETESSLNIVSVYNTRSRKRKNLSKTNRPSKRLKIQKRLAIDEPAITKNPEKLAEAILVQYLFFMKNRFFNVSISDVFKAAVQIYNSSITPNITWYKILKKKHFHLIFPINQNNTPTIQDNFNKFYDMLEEEYLYKNYQPCRIFTIIISVFLVKKIKSKSTQNASEKEKDIKIITINCVSANGKFVHPFIIAPINTSQKPYSTRVPTGSSIFERPSPSLTTKIFFNWFENFVHYVRPNVANPVLLLLDGNQKYARDYKIVRYAKVNNVNLISYPPASGVKLNPMLKSFVKNLKLAFNKEVTDFVKNNRRLIHDVHDVLDLYTKSYYSSCNSNIVEEFCEKKIYPFNKCRLIKIEEKNNIISKFLLQNKL